MLLTFHLTDFYPSFYALMPSRPIYGWSLNCELLFYNLLQLLVNFLKE